MADALTDEKTFDFLPNKTKAFLRPLFNFTNPLGNQLFDKWQEKLSRQLRNFSGDDVGFLFKMLPKKFREATASIASALADPLNSLGDKFQENTNKAIHNFPQSQIESEIETEAQLEAKLVAELEDYEDFYAQESIRA